LMWFLILFLYLEFGSMSFFTYEPIHKLPRHLTVLTIPALLCLSYFLLEIYDSRKKIKLKFIDVNRFIVIIIIVFLLITSINFTYQNSTYLNASTHDMKKIYEYMEDNPNKFFYIHDYTYPFISLYDGYDNNTQYEYYNLETLLENLENLENSFIVVYATRSECYNNELEYL